MSFDFHQTINRVGTDSSKWDDFQGRFPGLDASGCLPMWVADTDFTAPRQIIDAVVDKAEFGVYGYPARNQPRYLEAVQQWLKHRHGWRVEQDWIVNTPGVVNAVTLAIQAFTEEGDGVIIQQPVYYPFRRCIENNGRKVVNNPLRYTGEQYEIDFADLRAKCQDPANKLFVLCSPHNPVGRVWTPEELAELADICRENNVLIFSDEIHADLTFPGHRHTPLVSLVPALGERIITGYSASKSFNLAGLQLSSILISDNKLRQRFQQQIERNSLSVPGLFGPAATIAAYTHGGEYLDRFRDYVWENVQYAEAFAREHLPGMRVVRPQGTYLVWIDCRDTGFSPRDIDRLLIEQAKVAVDLGGWFGAEGAGFFRINLACPRSTVEEGFGRIQRALKQIKPASRVNNKSN